MKLITWNCNMAFRNKFQNLMDFKPDLLVIQECEHEEKLKPFLATAAYNQLFWFGENKHKGLAVITFNDAEVLNTSTYQEDHKYIVPLKLSISGRMINLFIIWAMPFKNSPLKSYVAQVWRAVNHFEKALQKPSILIGDFNSNAIWDKQRKVGNHSEVADFLAERKIVSLYHSKRNEQHGQELEPTFYLLKNREKPYHLDYCFASESLIKDETIIEVGKYDEWIGLSDHMPVIIDNIL